MEPSEHLQDRETISHVSMTFWRSHSKPAIVRWRGRSLKAERHLPRWKQRFDSFRPLHYEPPASTIRGRLFFETNVVQIAGRLLPARPLDSRKTLLSPSS